MIIDPLLHFRSKVGAKFEDKDAARQVRNGKYSLVDLDSFESPPVSGLPKKAAKCVFLPHTFRVPLFCPGLSDALHK